MDVHAFLAAVWYLLLGVILILYVMSGGFDLGVGILALPEGDASRRACMLAAISGIRDANAIWLVLFGAALFGAFPAAFAVTLHALYIPAGVMLSGLILRGIAFACYARTRDSRIWSRTFGGGSLAAALMQGYMLGAVISGLPVRGGGFAGSAWSWLGMFSSVVAVGVVAGYALLGGTYLLARTEGGLQASSRRRSSQAAWVMLAAACVVVAALLSHGYVAHRWFTLPQGLFLAMLPLAGLAAFARLIRTLQHGDGHAPFTWSRVVFLASFVGLAASLYPYLVPPAISLAGAASSSTTLVFMLVGIGMLLPVMLVYNGYRYLVMRGKMLQERPEPDSLPGSRDAGTPDHARPGSIRR